MFSLCFTYVIASDGAQTDTPSVSWLTHCVGKKVHAVFESRGRYHTGHLDSLPCVVSGIRVSLRPDVASTADAKFSNGEMISTTLEFFLPLRPQLGDFALPLSGSRKGQPLHVESLDQDTGDLTGKLVEEGDMLFTVPATDAVKLEYL